LPGGQQSAGTPAAGRPELCELVRHLAANRPSWQHLVRHDAGQRTYEQMVLNERVGVWLICWMDDHDTGFHDHDVSSGAVAVVEGLLLEERMRVGREPASRIYSPGEVFAFESSDIHRMAHAGGGPAISIHAYSPPLNRMGAYAVDEMGTLSRRSIPYSDELRPAVQ
jgi:predicted metal-dependent enzyme (double-stranded beta helix superfamily)